MIVTCNIFQACTFFSVEGAGLRPLSRWYCGFESRRGHGCLSLVFCIACCEVDVSATGRSLVPPHVVCHCVWSGNVKNEAALAPVWALAPEGRRGGGNTFFSIKYFLLSRRCKSI